MKIKATFDDAVRAIKEGNNCELRKYLDEGLSANATDKYGTTLLMLASVYGNYKTLGILIKSGANLHVSNGRTALQYAIENGMYDNVVFLVLHGADLNEKNEFGVYPLYSALEQGNYEIANWLLKNDAKFYAEDPTHGFDVLMKHDDIPDQTLELLVKAGLDINYREGKLLRWAACKGNECLVKALLANGADPNAMHDGYYVLHYAIAYGTTDKVVEALILAGAYVNARDVYGNTPLHHIARQKYDLNRIRIMNVLLENGANPRLRNSSGESSYQIASRMLTIDNNSRASWTIKSYAKKEE